MQMTLQVISSLGTPPSVLPKTKYLEILPGMDYLLHFKGNYIFFCGLKVLKRSSQEDSLLTQVCLMFPLFYKRKSSTQKLLSPYLPSPSFAVAKKKLDK